MTVRASMHLTSGCSEGFRIFSNGIHWSTVMSLHIVRTVESYFATHGQPTDSLGIPQNSVRTPGKRIFEMTDLEITEGRIKGMWL
jgi:hypothetical protein